MVLFEINIAKFLHVHVFSFRVNWDEFEINVKKVFFCRSVGGGRLGTVVKPLVFFCAFSRHLALLARCHVFSQTTNKNRRHDVLGCRHAVNDQLGSLRSFIFALS
jgi:hypothetical protein